MKRIIAALSLTIVLCTSSLVFAGIGDEDSTRTQIQKPGMSTMMGSPTFDGTVDGLRMKVWVMTQKEHKEMAGGKMDNMMVSRDATNPEAKGISDTTMSGMTQMKPAGTGMSTMMADSMMTGTHHIMVEISDAATGSAITGATEKVGIVSPTQKNSSLVLHPMMKHFGGSLNLTEKGDYMLTLRVDTKGLTKTRQFAYAVK
jgi:hypothetical protein